jgi:hypothetical protein
MTANDNEVIRKAALRPVYIHGFTPDSQRRKVLIQG